MNANDPKSSKNVNPSSQQPAEKQPPGESTPPITPPLASPDEPTRAYPTDPSRAYSSDPSQYATPQKPTSDESSKIYTTEPLDTARITNEERKAYENQAKKERKTFEDKTQQTTSNPNNSNQTEDFYTFATSNKEHTIAYVLLILGLFLLLFFNNLLGGLILGMVAGYFFSAEIVHYIRNLGQILRGQDQLRYVVLAALALGLFIAAPGIFIGALIVATFKQVMAGPRG